MEFEDLARAIALPDVLEDYCKNSLLYGERPRDQRGDLMTRIKTLAIAKQVESFENQQIHDTAKRAVKTIQAADNTAKISADSPELPDPARLRCDPQAEAALRAVVAAPIPK